MKPILKLVLILILFNLSCSRNEELIFPYELIDWMPYEGVSELRYTNHSDTVCFNLIKNTGSYNGRYTIDYSHVPGYYIESEIDTSINLKLEIILEAYKGEGYLDIYFIDNLNNLDSFNIHFEGGKAEHQIDEIIINGELYYNSMIMENIEMNTQISKIIYVEKFGLIQFIMNDEEWNLIIE